MKTVWKYPLAVTDTQFVQMPKGAQLLTVQPQGDAVCLWARVEDTNKPETRIIGIAGTGYPLPDDTKLDYIGTFQLHGGSLVFHAFEVMP